MSYKIEESVDYSDSRIKLGNGYNGSSFLVYDHVKKVFVVVKKFYKNQYNFRFMPHYSNDHLKMEIDCSNHKFYPSPLVPLLANGAPPENDDMYEHYLYFDFMCGGTLKEIIQQLRFVKSKEEWEEEDLEENGLVGWGLKQELIIAYGTAKALQFVHETGIYREFEPANIFLTHDLEPKICDYSRGRKTTIRTHEISIVAGTWYYNDPEMNNNEDGISEGSFETKIKTYGDHGTPSDMYSWAMTMYEMTTLKCPFEDYIREGDKKSEQRCKIQIITNSLRPKFPEDYDHPLKEIIEVCWDKLPENRYTAEVACQKIYEIARNVLEGEDFDVFNLYMNKVEKSRDLDEYEGFQENIEAAMSRNIAKAYYISHCLYKNRIYHQKDTEKADQLYSQYNYMISGY